MKLDFLSIHEVETNAKVETPKGGLQLRCSDPYAPIYIEAYGVEVLAGVGSCDCVFSEEPEATFRVESKKGARAFLTLSPRQTYAPRGERFTNMDRRPHESGTMDEVKRGLRLFHLQQRDLLREMKAERQALEDARSKNTTDPALNPEPAPRASDQDMASNAENQSEPDQ